MEAGKTPGQNLGANAGRGMGCLSLFTFMTIGMWKLIEVNHIMKCAMPPCLQYERLSWHEFSQMAVSREFALVPAAQNSAHDFEMLVHAGTEPP